MSDYKLSKEDFERIGWQEIIAGSSDKTCWSYSSLYRQRAEEVHVAGDALAEAVLRKLELWSFPRLQTDNPARPFPEVFLDTIDEPDNILLRELAPLARDAELRARLADLAWLGKVNNRRDPDMARLAVPAYLTASEAFGEQNLWPERIMRIERALQLALSLGRAAPDLVDEVWTHIEKTLGQINGDDEWFLSAELMELLQEYGRGDAATYAPMAERAALKAERQRGVGQWAKARRYWEVKAGWYPADSEDQRTALVRAAETYVADAEDELRGYDNPIGAAGHLERAIQAYRKLNQNGQFHERINEIHRALIDINQRAQKSFETYQYPLNVEKYAAQAAGQVAGKTLGAALRELVLIAAPPEVETLREQVALHTDEFIELMCSHERVNADGQVIARRPSLFAPDPQQREEAITAEMFHIAGTHHALCIHGFIVPALLQIRQEHRVRTRDWLPLLRHSPFVPQGRELIFARGLQAGFEGDWLVSTHLLVPQIENSIRYILHQNQAIASALHNDGTQSEQGLDQTLLKPKLATLLPEDVIFDLRGLLVEQMGDYLRHKTCHGLASYDEFHSVPSVYLWWTTLRMCLLPLINAQPQNSTQSQGSTQSQPTNNQEGLAEAENVPDSPPENGTDS
jgi:hypothetical protein